MTRRLIQLLIASVAVGIGVALMLHAGFGADGFGMGIDGLSMRFEVPFVVVNIIVSAALVLIAWVRGLTPGIGTLTGPVLIGVMVSALQAGLPDVESFGVRLLVFAGGYLSTAVGVAAYVGADVGTGPTEAVALVWDPPVPFRYAYIGVQFSFAFVGWWFGSPLNFGTVLVVFGLGPIVDRILPHVDLRPPSAPAGRVAF